MTNKPLVINVTGSCGKTTTSRLIERILTGLGYKVGLATTAGIFINGKRITSRDRARKKGYELLHKHSTGLDFVVCENSLRPPNLELVSFYPERSSVCLITNIHADHMNHTRTTSVQEIADLKAKLIERNLPSGTVILNADNKYLIEVARRKKIKHLALFALSEDSFVKLKGITSEVKYFIRNTNLFRKKGKNEYTKLIDNVDKIPFTLNLKVEFNLYNLLAAMAVIDSLGVGKAEEQRVRNVLKKLSLDHDNFPGRFNLYDFKNFQVILDFAQNPKGYREIFKAVKKIPHKRLVAILKASSTKPKDMVIRLGRIAAKNADFIYLKELFSRTSEKRKKLGGVVAGYLREGLRKENFNTNKTKEILFEENALEDALENAQKGDLILVLGYRVDKLNEILERHRSNYP